MKNLLLSTFMLLLFYPSVFSQVIDDPATMNMSRVEMGNYYLTKAKKQKRNAWLLVGGSVVSLVAATALLGAEGDHTDAQEIAGLGFALVSTAATVASWPAFARGARSTGMAHMLLTEPGQNPDRNYVKNLATTYQQKAKSNSVIAWSMLAGGLIIFYASIASETEVVPYVGAAAIFGSIPFFAAAAKNKGRVSVLVRNQSIPVSHMSGSSMYRSIGVSVPITR